MKIAMLTPSMSAVLLYVWVCTVHASQHWGEIYWYHTKWTWHTFINPSRFVKQPNHFCCCCCFLLSFSSLSVCLMLYSRFSFIVYFLYLYSHILCLEHHINGFTRSNSWPITTHMEQNTHSHACSHTRCVCYDCYTIHVCIASRRRRK